MALGEFSRTDENTQAKTACAGEKTPDFSHQEQTGIMQHQASRACYSPILSGRGAGGRGGGRGRGGRGGGRRSSEKEGREGVQEGGGGGEGVAFWFPTKPRKNQNATKFLGGLGGEGSAGGREEAATAMKTIGRDCRRA